MNEGRNRIDTYRILLIAIGSVARLFACLFTFVLVSVFLLCLVFAAFVSSDSSVYVFIVDHLNVSTPRTVLIFTHTRYWKGGGAKKGLRFGRFFWYYISFWLLPSSECVEIVGMAEIRFSIVIILSVTNKVKSSEIKVNPNHMLPFTFCFGSTDFFIYRIGNAFVWY